MQSRSNRVVGNLIEDILNLLSGIVVDLIEDEVPDKVCEVVATIISSSGNGLLSQVRCLDFRPIELRMVNSDSYLYPSRLKLQHRLFDYLGSNCGWCQHYGQSAGNDLVRL